MYFEDTQQILQATISGVQCQDKVPWLSGLTDESGILCLNLVQESKQWSERTDLAKAEHNRSII